MVRLLGPLKTASRHSSQTSPGELLRPRHRSPSRYRRPAKVSGPDPRLGRPTWRGFRFPPPVHVGLDPSPRHRADVRVCISRGTHCNSNPHRLALAASADAHAAGNLAVAFPRPGSRGSSRISRSRRGPAVVGQGDAETDSESERYGAAPSDSGRETARRLDGNLPHGAVDGRMVELFQILNETHLTGQPPQQMAGRECLRLISPCLDVCNSSCRR